MNVFVTGGSGSIGSAIVVKFQENGHNVFYPTRNEIDLSTDFILDNPKYDIVVNNAGINHLMDIYDDYHDVVMKTNYSAPLSIIKQCLPYMINNQYGRIVNIGSIWSSISKKKRWAYSASKSALDSLSRSLTSECSHHNILINTISPGFIDTPLTYKNNNREELEKIKRSIPMGRLGLPHEIANLVYTLTVENTYITGQNIIIDGGFLCTRI